MTVYDDLPVPEGPDPVESADDMALRGEILRLRESLLASNGRVEVLRDRIDELERTERELHAANRALHEELGRNPVIRIVRSVRRRLSGGP